MHPEIEKLVQMSLVDGQVTDNEREIILRKAVKLGLDVDEVEMYLEGFISSSKSNANPEINQEILENREIKTSKKNVYKARNFTPKIVKHIEPALLDKEKEIKLNIEELNTSKTVLFEELENLYENIKSPKDFLESQKVLVQNQLGVLKSEFSKTSKIYLDKFIDQLNTTVSEKYCKTSLIYNNPEELFGLKSNEIVKMILDKGAWDISTLSNKYNKKKLFYKVLMWVSIIAVVINGLIQKEKHESAGWGTGIWFFSFFISMIISSYYSGLIKNNKMNFTDEDLNPIIKDIIKKFEYELEELVSLKNDINNLEKLKSKLELKKIIEFNRK
jgi:hypothetical protein